MVAVTMYWRPGCGFCSMLQRDLDAAELEYEKVNIWEDPAAAEYVRSVARGYETVPTVTVGDTALVNPDVHQITALLDAEAGSDVAASPEDQSTE
ncbi:MAG: NrdH-redoxin [Acidimicrobiia bacterium]|nr:NrdH-redoxin [Acidimicrobiia bacterium]